jgi:hypothetical protein
VSNSDLVFFIDVRSGFTKRLAGCVSSSDVTMMKLNVLVDGPYGSPPDLRVFDTCVLLAGGYFHLCRLDGANEYYDKVARVHHTHSRCSLIS